MEPVTSIKRQLVKAFSTQELVQACLLHDQEAWKEFLRRYVSLIKKMIKNNLHRYQCPQWNDIDVIEDIWVMIFEKIYAGNGLALCTHFDNFEGWLWSIANSKTVDYCRAKRRSGQYDIQVKDDADKDVFATVNWFEQLMNAEENMKYLNNAMVELSELDNDKIKWTIRLLIMAEEPLSHAEIEALAQTFKCYNAKTIREKLQKIQRRLYSEISEKQKDGERADKIWHEIMKLEKQLKDKFKYGKANTEAAEIERIIQQKDRRRQELLDKSVLLCRPSNSEIANLIGLSEEQAQQVSVFLIRARERIKIGMKKKGFLK